MHSAGRGSGSTFEVRLPLSGTPPESEKWQAPSQSLPSLQSVACQRRVLVVEDSEDIRESSCELLSLEGFEVAGVIAVALKLWGSRRILILT